ncbi:MAG TPA: hypothetical protein VN796_10020 [Acidimicrobiales bacterium]|nr:hypothetical protein [Acidimicrobiales bacterium]
MVEVTVVETDAGSYSVTVHVAGRTTTHHVRVPPHLPRALGCSEVPVADLVRCSFAFLLEREPSTSILRSFSLEQIGDYFPEYGDTMRSTLSGEGSGSTRSK